MPESADDIVLPITLDTAAAERALNDFQARAKTHGQQAARGFEAGTRGTDAGGFFDRIRGKMLEYRREEVAQTRSTRFFAQEIAGLIPVGNEVGATLAKLAITFSGGLGLGTALELGKFALEKFTEALRENERVAREHQAQLTAVWEVLEKYKRSASGASQIEVEFQDKTKESQKALIHLGRELEDVTEKIVRMREQRQALAMGGLLGRRDEIEKEMRQHRAVIDAAKVAQEEAQRAASAGRAGEAVKRVDAEERQSLERRTALATQFQGQAKALHREAILAQLDEQGKIKQALKFQIDDLKAFGVEKKDLQKAIADATRIAAEKGRQIALAQLAASERDRQIALAAAKREGDAKLAAQIAAQEKELELRRRFQFMREAGYRSDLAGRLQTIDQAQRQELELLKSGRERVLVGEEEFERAKAKITTKYAKERQQAFLESQSTQLAGAQQFFGTLAQMQSSSVTELAGIGKAAAITQATIDGILGVQKALATLPPPYSFVMAAAVGAVAAANVAQIAGTRAMGGPVSGGELYLVGEEGPELFRPGVSGSVVPNHAIAQPTTMNVSIQNHAPGVRHEVRQISATEVEIIARDVVQRDTPRVVEGQLADPNSRSSRALSRNTSANRRRS